MAEATNKATSGCGLNKHMWTYSEAALLCSVCPGLKPARSVRGTQPAPSCRLFLSLERRMEGQVRRIAPLQAVPYLLPVWQTIA